MEGYRRRQNYVCVDCRTPKRLSAHCLSLPFDQRLCSRCGTRLLRVNTTPAQGDTKEWKRLRFLVHQREVAKPFTIGGGR